MLRRLHIDNYKSLVNFDLELGRTHLLLGRNGTGKSAVFAALSQLLRFLHLDRSTPDVFSASTCTRWESRNRQTFEFDLQGDDEGAYRYRLEIEFIKNRPFVALESLTVADVPVFRRAEDSVQLFKKDGTARPGELLVDVESSAIPRLTGRHGDSRLDALRAKLARVHVVSIHPERIKPTSHEESTVLAENLENFASWYRHLTQDQPGNIRNLEEDLQELLGPEFQNLRLARIVTEEGLARELRVEWRTDPAQADTKFELRFDELSDGQRALICLYALLHAGGDEPALLCIDEPDNFVALTEIQPWLMALSERESLQTLLISHHPEIIDRAADTALFFYRRGQGPTRVRRFAECVDPDEPLTASELVARGWVDADS